MNDVILFWRGARCVGATGFSEMARFVYFMSFVFGNCNFWVLESVALSYTSGRRPVITPCLTDLRFFVSIQTYVTLYSFTAKSRTSLFFLTLFFNAFSYIRNVMLLFATLLFILFVHS